MPAVMAVVDVDIAGVVFGAIVFDVAVVVGEGVGSAIINVFVLGSCERIGGLLLRYGG